MASMTFQVNDGSTASGYPNVWVTISENGDGTLAFNVTQEGGVVGDLRGLFFDVADESLLNSLVVNADSNDVRIGNDSITNLGGGSNMNGLTGSDRGYDVGIEVGTSGIAKDDIQSYEFTLSSSSRDLTLQDFANVDFGVRLTSVGTVDGSREDSSKILEQTSVAIEASSDSENVVEGQIVSGDVFENDNSEGGINTVSGWDGGTVGNTVRLVDEGDDLGSLTLNADGTYSVDASGADELSAGETATFTYSLDLTNQTEETSWSNDTSTFTITLTGTNDAVVIGEADLSGAVTELEDGDEGENTAVLSDTGTIAFTDVDRSDTHTVSSSAKGDDYLGNFSSSIVDGEVQWTFNVNDADIDHLGEGETLTQYYDVTIDDDEGGAAIETVTVTITGSADDDTPPSPPPVDDPGVTVLYNHGTQQTGHGFFPQASEGQDKTNVYEGFNDNDTLKIAGYGDADDLTIYQGDFGLGDPTIDDTLFVIGIDGNQKSTRTEDWGYLEDYTGLTEDNVWMTGVTFGDGAKETTFEVVETIENPEQLVDYSQYLLG